uniref:Uncharacterized protein n=1 Tax=Arundo donax TaxID=35708 RepID=A0A0A9FU13_ARUDO
MFLKTTLLEQCLYSQVMATVIKKC